MVVLAVTAAPCTVYEAKNKLIAEKNQLTLVILRFEASRQFRYISVLIFATTC